MACPSSPLTQLSLSHTHTILGRHLTSLTNVPQVIPAQHPEQEVKNAGTANQSKLPLCMPTHFYSKLTHTLSKKTRIKDVHNLMSPKLITMVSTSPVQSSKKTSSQSECVSLRVHVCPAVCVRYRESARARERERETQ